MAPAPAVLTVGSTEFTPLVHAFLSPQSLLALRSLALSSALVQVGHSTLPTGWQLGSTTRHGLTLELVKFVDDIESVVGQAKLVISHAGAGSILSFLRPVGGGESDGRQLVLVPNDGLMDSHQSDLALELATRGWAIVCLPETLGKTLEVLSESEGGSAQLGDGAASPALEPAKMANIVNSTLGYA